MAIGLLLFVQAALARTWTVDGGGGGDFVALQPAIDAAATGDRIEVRPGTYTGAITWSGKDLVIEATDGAASTTLTGPGYGALLTMSSLGTGSRLAGFTLQNPGGTGILASGVAATFDALVLAGLGTDEAYGGAAYVSGGASTWSGVEFSSNAAYAGGAVYADSGAALTFVDCVLTGNGAADSGGAVYLAGATLDDTRGAWTDNVAYYNGGDVYSGYGGGLRLDASTFQDSTATYGYGGSVYAQSGFELQASAVRWATPYAYYSGAAVYLYDTGTTASFDTVSVEGGQAVYGGGGAIYAYYRAGVDISASSFTECAAGAQGGAIYSVYYVDLAVRDSSFDRNSTDSAGGAIYYDSWSTGFGGIDLSDSSFSGNVAVYEGGAAMIGTGDVERIERSSFEGNIAGADAFGGALELHGGIEVIARNNSFRANAAGHGGAVYVGGNYSGAGHDTWSNNLFVENSARVGGAACFAENGSTSFLNNTLVGNAASEEAGALCFYANPADLRNNIFAETTSRPALHAYDASSVDTSTLRFNDFHGNVDGDTSGAFPASPDGSNLAASPGFVAYAADAEADDSFVLRPDSKLVDAGDPAVLDPDGSRSDIGAYGGPDAWVTDADGDGVDRLHDCDDSDPSVAPGKQETWYDGVDQDCDGSDDDQDGDGLGVDEDCDDVDAKVGACAEAPKGDDPGEGCACAHGAPSPTVALLLALLGLRRRR